MKCTCIWRTDIYLWRCFSTSALLKPGSHVGFSLFLHLLQWSPQEKLKHLLVFLALLQIWCDPGGGTWCVILSTTQKKRCKICLQARHRAKERRLGTHSILTFQASHPAKRFTPPGTQSSLPRQAHLNPWEILVSHSCSGDAGSPALCCEASLKTDVSSGARMLSETELANDGGSTQATMLPVPKAQANASSWTLCAWDSWAACHTEKCNSAKLVWDSCTSRFAQQLFFPKCLFTCYKQQVMLKQGKRRISPKLS